MTPQLGHPAGGPPLRGARGYRRRPRAGGDVPTRRRAEYAAVVVGSANRSLNTGGYGYWLFQGRQPYVTRVTGE